jgi:hypothetical protein
MAQTLAMGLYLRVIWCGTLRRTSGQPSAICLVCWGWWLVALLHSTPGAAVAQVAQRWDAQPQPFTVGQASSSPQDLVHWVLRTADHQGLPFVVIDKRAARVWVYHPSGQLRGSAPALLGLALGEGSAAGVGERPLAQIRPEERTTPAGRYVAELGHNLHGQSLLWIDYAQALSLHPLRRSDPLERRSERLATHTAQDNRITYGCINVSEQFWQAVVMPTFRGTQGLVYVLPESAWAAWPGADATQDKAAAE